MATDAFKFVQSNDTTSSPARNAVTIAPNDSTDLSLAPKALYVGGAGDIALIPLDGTAAVTFKACPAGLILPVRVSRVLATGTTATNLVALL